MPVWIFILTLLKVHVYMGQDKYIAARIAHKRPLNP